MVVRGVVPVAVVPTRGVGVVGVSNVSCFLQRGLVAVLSASWVVSAWFVLVRSFVGPSDGGDYVVFSRDFYVLHMLSLTLAFVLVLQQPCPRVSNEFPHSLPRP